MADSKQTGGIGFIGMLTILFIALKLIGVISWSWWWVLSPILGSIAVVVLFIVVIALVLFLRKGKKK